MLCKKNFLCLILLSSFVAPVFSSHNTSRYFPFLEKPEDYLTHGKSHIYPALFLTTASTAYRSGGNTGIPELTGRYNLKSVIAGLAAVKESQGVSGYNPFKNEVGYSDWNGKDIRYRLDGKIKSRGVLLSAEQIIGKTGFSVGASVPFMQVNTSMRFFLDRENSDAGPRQATVEEEDMLNRVRRDVSCNLGLKGDDWSKSGFGDLDVYVMWRKWWDHTWKMKTIDLNLRTGVIAPTGQMRDEDYPTSIPFMGNGHWGTYGDVLCEFELKQNWKLGGLLGLMYEFEDTAVRRVSYSGEPTMFSALKGDIQVKPGITFKASPYFTLENFVDGAHAQFRYTYRRHSHDTWVDRRGCCAVESYLTSDRSHEDCARELKSKLSEWTSHILTLQLEYDSVEAMKNWWMKPKFYALVDYSMSGKNVCKTHQLTVGVQLHPW